MTFKPMTAKCRVCGEVLRVEVHYMDQCPADCRSMAAIKFRWHGWTSNSDTGPWLCPKDRDFARVVA